MYGHVNVKYRFLNGVFDLFTMIMAKYDILRLCVINNTFAGISRAYCWKICTRYVS